MLDAKQWVKHPWNAFGKKVVSILGYVTHGLLSAGRGRGATLQADALRPSVFPLMPADKYRLEDWGSGSVRSSHHTVSGASKN